MKAFLFAAGTILFSTSALAGASSPRDASDMIMKPAKFEAMKPMVGDACVPASAWLADKDAALSSAKGVQDAADEVMPAKGDANMAMAADTKPATDMSVYTGQGGPDEAMDASSEGTRAGYPPCTRRRQDSCIQLYERGVSGMGN